MKRSREKKNQLDPNHSQDHILDLGQNPDQGLGLVPSPVATNCIHVGFRHVRFIYTQFSLLKLSGIQCCNSAKTTTRKNFLSVFPVADNG